MKNHFLTKEAWGFLVLTVICVSALFAFVDLSPHVDYDTFFSNDDPTYRADIEISRLFPRNDTQIIISVSGDIYSTTYQKKIKNFGELLMDIEHVVEVKSIVNGPRSVYDAVKSSLWSRLLISDQERSSNMLVMIDPAASQEHLSAIVPRIENLKSVFDSKDFHIEISGYPYIVELIRRHLNRDLRVFSILAFIVFGLVVVMVFHSWRIFLGTMIACFNAAALTLICSHFLDIKIGILTANLTTIIFVLTLSHIIFLTFNWKHLYGIDNQKEAVHEAIKITFPASFWAMVTTLLGFLSLLYVQAKPIRELGVLGSIGTAIAFAIAYSVYPAFLRLARPSHERSDLFIKHLFQRTFTFFERRQWFVIVAIFGIIIFTIPDLRSLNTDPSLISFFAKDSKITHGLKYIDKHGGSNPLMIVVKDKSGDSLDNKKNIQRLWELHKEFEAHPEVGTAFSLPLLVNEARRSSLLSFMVSDRRLLKFLDKPKYGEISKGFITEDRQYALFLLRMREEGRQGHRITILNELKKITEENHFSPHLVGSIYAMQGHLSQHVANSMIYGLGRLILIFLLIALITSYSFRTAFGMALSVCVIPLCILGVIGALRMPLDMIAAPAANIAIAMGIDAMIHMVHAHRRLNNKKQNGTNTWLMVRKRLWEPVITSMLIVSCGFGIFFFSSFPPTQRFGGSIVLGTIVAAFSALFIFPLLAGGQKPYLPPKTPDKKKKDDHPEPFISLLERGGRVKDSSGPNLN